MLSYDPHTNGAQFLEDIATAYWGSQILFTAVEMEIFNAVKKNGELDFLSSYLSCDQINLRRFLDALVSMGLLTCYENSYYNTAISDNYLIKGKEDYQGNSILWRKNLMDSWQDLKDTIIRGKRINYITHDEQGLKERTEHYIKGMDDIARVKAKEILSIFHGLTLEGELLDVGSGSGIISKTFVEEFDGLKATLIDLEQVNSITRKRIGDERYSFHCQNILDDWDLKSQGYDLIIMSNIVHAYSEEEVKHIIREGVKHLSSHGYLIIHDFFMEHYKSKPQMFDLNMMINTYNGKVFKGSWLIDVLKENLVFTTGLVPLMGDTGVIIASKKENALHELKMHKTDTILGELQLSGLKHGLIIKTEDVVLSQMAQIKCQFGCDYYGKGHCPPNSMEFEKTKKLINEYDKGILIEGEPPTADFQNKLLKLEKKAFKEGYYKAFTFWAGPCSLCEKCTGKGKHCSSSRPSMEGSGIDVFETVRRLGINLKTLGDSEYVKYFGLLLLE